MPPLFSQVQGIEESVEPRRSADLRFDAASGRRRRIFDTSKMRLHKRVPFLLAGFAVVLTLAGGTAGKFGCGLLVARHGPVRVLVAINIMSTAAIMAVLAAPTMVAFCYLIPVAGLVLRGSSSFTHGTVGDLVEERRQSPAFALFYTLSSVAFIVGPRPGSGSSPTGSASRRRWSRWRSLSRFPPRLPSSFAMRCARSSSPTYARLDPPPSRLA